MNERDARWWLDHYGIHFGVLAVFAMLLVLAPSKGAIQTTASDRAGSDSSAPSSSGTGPATSAAPGAGPGAVSGGGAGGGGGGTGAGSGAGGGPAGPEGGVGFGEDCSRTELLGTRFGCMPLADGTNAGATYPGVTADRITVVAYYGRVDPQVDAVLGDQGYTNDPALVASQARAYAEWLQQHFQTWGRAVDLKFMLATTTEGDAAAGRADAVKAVQELGAAIVVTGGGPGINSAFTDEVTRRGVICICNAALNPPFGWTYGMDSTTYQAHFAEFACKKLGPTADYAGAGLAGRPRVFGYVHSQTDPTAEFFKSKLGECGIAVTREVAYSDDVTTAVQQATNIVQQAKSGGATTVLWPGAPYIAMYFGYAAAKNQQYYPEWVTGADSYFESRFLDQDQMSRTFGLSGAPPPSAEAETVGFRIYTQLRPGEPVPRPGFSFGQMELAFVGIERAGPSLDPASFERGMFTIRHSSTGPHDEAIGYGPGDYSGIEDMTEIWWDRNAVGPDGKPGAFQWVNGGKRYALGSWPATPTHPFKPECTASGSCGESG